MEETDKSICVCGHPKINHPRDADCIGACFLCDDGIGGSCSEFRPAHLPSWPRAIPVSERLPEDKSTVMAFEFDEWFSADFKNGDFAAHGMICQDVTHWLPLPPSPSAESASK